MFAEAVLQPKKNLGRSKSLGSRGQNFQRICGWWVTSEGLGVGSSGPGPASGLGVGSVMVGVDGLLVVVGKLVGSLCVWPGFLGCLLA